MRATLKILSLNVRGIHDYRKRRTMYRHFRDQKADIVMIQETHVTEKDYICWGNEWGNKTTWAGNDSRACGCGILFNNNRIDYKRSLNDPYGHFVIALVECDGEEFVVCNIYAPNVDDPNFFVRFLEQIQTFECANVIIGGDLNLVMDPVIDRKNSTANHSQSQCLLLQFMEEHEYVDIWRVRYPKLRRYTWSREHSASRIDYFILPTAISGWVTRCCIQPALKTDHQEISLEIEIPEMKRGPGVWRINNRILDNVDFQQKIRSMVQEIGSKEMDAIQKWELFKSRAAAIAREFSKKSASDTNVLLENLYSLKSIYVNEYNEMDNSLLQDNLQQITEKIEEIEREKTLSIIFRSRADWAREGEKNTKYFLSLEKRNYCAKTMFSIILDDGTICKDQQRILAEQRRFYEDLYSCRNETTFNLTNHTGVMLNDAQKLNLDADFSAAEFLDALKSMKKG